MTSHKYLGRSEIGQIQEIAAWPIGIYERDLNRRLEDLAAVSRLARSLPEDSFEHRRRRIDYRRREETKLGDQG